MPQSPQNKPVNQFSNRIYKYARELYKSNSSQTQQQKKSTITGKTLTPALEKTVTDLSRLIGVDPATARKIIAPHIINRFNKLNPNIEYDAQTIQSLESDALYYATEELAAQSAKNMAIINLSQETFSNAVYDKTTQTYNYLTNDYATDFSRDALLDNFYADKAKTTNISGEYAKNAAAQHVNDLRENELANGNRSRLPSPMLYALETLSKRTDITLYELKNMYNEIYTSQPESYWDNIAQRKFSEKGFQNAEFFRGRNRLTYLETLYQDNILGVMQRSLQNMHQNHEISYENNHVDFQKGYNHINQYKNISLEILQQLNPKLYDGLKNKLGLRDEQITSAVNSASKWCSEDYEDGIAAMKKAKYNHDINDNGELNFDDFYNVKGFLQKSWLRLNSLMGNDKSREINIIRQSERISNENGDSYLTPDWGNAMSEPLKTVGTFTPLLALFNPALGATFATISATDSIASQQENNQQLLKQGVKHEQIYKDNTINILSNIGSIIAGKVVSPIIEETAKISNKVSNAGVDLTTKAIDTGIKLFTDTSKTDKLNFTSPFPSPTDSKPDYYIKKSLPKPNNNIKDFNNNTKINKPKLQPRLSSPTDELKAANTGKRYSGQTGGFQKLDKRIYGSM